MKGYLPPLLLHLMHQRKRKRIAKISKVISKDNTELKNETNSVGIKRSACPMEIDIPLKKIQSIQNSATGVVAAQNQP